MPAELPPDAPIFSRPLALDEVRDHGLKRTITATPEECAALAKFDKLGGIDRLEASFSVTRRGRHGLHVEGEVRALVHQICVVSLEPFPTEIIEDIEVAYAPEEEALAAHAKAAAEIEAATDKALALAMQDDPPDAIIDGRIDLGALAAEFLALGLDAYPRKPGVDFSTLPGAVDAPEKSSPFAALKKLKNDD
jgi:uncharacterized metal-binding protein YceD (DUF177 family)